LNKILVLTGPTATGKSSLSIELAEKFNLEIVNIDSMQVYKYFNIGTDKPDNTILEKYPHHLISYVEPDEFFDVKRYINDADKIVENILSRKKIPLFVGGTGLYIKCFLFGIIAEESDDSKLREYFNQFSFEYLYSKLKIIDYKSYKKIKKNDKYRTVRALSYFYNSGKLISEIREQHKFQKPRYNYLKFAISFNREELYEKINKRVDSMIEKGLIDETVNLIDRGYENTRPMNGIGYREIKLFLQGKLTKDSAINLIKQNTRKYAKRQITWFKKENDITWINSQNKKSIFKKIENFLQDWLWLKILIFKTNFSTN